MNASVHIDTKNRNSITSLFFIQTFATLGFAVLYSTIVLYTTKKLGFSEPEANGIMAVFGAFNYGLHLFGGYLGGRFLSNRTLFLLGMLVQIAGCALLSQTTVTTLYWGLALFLTGSGLNVTCINMMLTQRFSPKDPRRESAFLWNYAGMNLGFFIGFSASGYFQLTESYRQLFLFSTIGNVISITLTLLFWKHLIDSNTPLTRATRAQQIRGFVIGIIILTVLVPTIRFMLNNTSLTGSLVLVLGSLIFILLALLTVLHPVVAEKARMTAFLILMLGGLVFWTLYLMVPMGLTLFAEHNIDMKLGKLQIAPQWLQNINTVVIVLAGPLLANLFKKWRAKGINIDIPVQFSAALLLIGFGMLILPIGISLAPATGLVNVQWIAWSYVLQSIGELLLSPVGYAMIGRLAPEQYQGVMMGSWMMVTGVASILAGHVSSTMPQANIGSAFDTNAGYSHIFNMLGWSSVVAGVIIALLVPKLRTLIAGKLTA